MADIISKDRKHTRAPEAAEPFERAAPVSAKVDDGSLLPLVEMLFFAYRDFTGEADAALEAYGLGRAHHRVLHFVNRNPGIRVADLLELLKITKQSLGRVLRKLVADNWIEQMPGPDDRRERHLTATASGRVLATELAALQTARIDAALREIEHVRPVTPRVHIRDFLFAMISDGERSAVSAVVNGTANRPSLAKPALTKKEPRPCPRR